MLCPKSRICVGYRRQGSLGKLQARVCGRICGRVGWELFSTQSLPQGSTPGSLASSMSEASWEGPGTPTTPLPPATGIWGVLRAWVYDNPSAQRTTAKLLNPGPETNLKTAVPAAVCKQQVQAVAANRYVLRLQSMQPSVQLCETVFNRPYCGTCETQASVCMLL